MVKICFSQIDVEPGHPDLNVERMLQAIDEAKQNNTDIIIFPEMCIPGYLLGTNSIFKRLFKLWRRYYRSFSRYLYHFW
jgi:predicted amidohydrolase